MQILAGGSMPTLDNIEFVGMVDHVEDSIFNILTDSETYSNDDFSNRSHHPSRECFMADTLEGRVAEASDSSSHHDNATPAAPEQPRQTPIASAPPHLSPRRLEELQTQQQALAEARRKLE